MSASGSAAGAPRALPALDEGGRDPAARWMLLAALALGLLRFFRLGTWSLWFDEAATWTDVHTGLEGGEIGNPLGYRAIALAVQALGGTPDELALRFLPALFGWLSIPLAYWAFAPFAGARRSAAAALIVAASSWHLYWSQNARFYTMAQVVSLAGAGLVLRGLWRASIPRALLGFAVAAAAASLHPSAGLVLPALALAPFAARSLARGAERPDWRPAAGILALGAAVLALRFEWARTTIQNYLRQKPASDPAHFVLTTGFYVTPLLATAALLGTLVALKRRDAFHVFAACVCAVALLAALLLSTLARISAQYVFVVLPWIAILAAVPLSEGGPVGASWMAAAENRMLKLLRAGWLALLVLPALSTQALYFTARKGERPQWREAFELVWEMHEEGDLILAMEATAGEHYLAPGRTDLRNTAHVAWLDRWRAREPRNWARHARRTWYVLNPEQLLDWEAGERADFQRFLREECRLVKCFPLYVESRDLSVWVYVRG